MERDQVRALARPRELALRLPQVLLQLALERVELPPLVLEQVPELAAVQALELVRASQLQQLARVVHLLVVLALTPVQERAPEQLPPPAPLQRRHHGTPITGVEPGRAPMIRKRLGPNGARTLK